MDIKSFVAANAEISLTEGKAPIVSMYSGVEGIKHIYEDTLTLPNTEAIYAFLNPSSVDPTIYKWLTTEYVKARVEKGIFANVFVTGPKNAQEVETYKNGDTTELRKTFIVEDFDKPFECEVDIYGDKIALINYKPNELYGIIINNATIVSTIKAFYLHYLWKL